jgi:squalene-hopene/tetraprenyl-beta-curcumene cyclase
MALDVARGVDRAARQALDRATARVLAVQHPQGWWKGELETNVTMDAEDLFLREFLGLREQAATARTAAWIRSRQRADGTWATFHGGPGDLSTSVEAYAALRLAGDPPDAAHLRRAAGFIRDAGGVERTRVFTRLWLALFGLWDWGRLPAVPPELILLPAWCPLNVYDFACWARQTLVPVAVVAALRPVRPAATDLVAELRSGAADPPPPRLPSWVGAFQRLDRALHAYQRRPIGRLRRQALTRAGAWIQDRQEADGSWGGIQPPWVWSLLALHLLGYPLEHPVLRAGLAGLDRFTIDHDGLRRLEACQSPVWDTALAVIALRDAGLPADHPRLVRAGTWLLGQEVTKRGDWAVRRRRLAPGGWAFEFANDTYPDVDDTAEVLLALRRLELPDPAARDAACARGLAWMTGMQSRCGGFAAFDVDNTARLPARLPFCDFGEVTDPPSADVTAHALEALAAAGLSRSRTTKRGWAWLLAQQKADGSWFGRWGSNHVYGTGAVLAAGLPAGDPAAARGVAWLQAHQNPDGGWGEDLRSYRDPAWRGRGPSTASQTAWALLGLLAVGGPTAVTDQGVAWLVANQQPDGGWDEPWFTGTGFPGDFYINYHLYRLVFPVLALGRHLEAVR